MVRNQSLEAFTNQEGRAIKEEMAKQSETEQSDKLRGEKAK